MSEPTRDTRSDWRITLILVLTGAVVTLIGFGTPFVISTADATREVKIGNEIQSCRSQQGAKVTDARSALDVASANLELLTNSGLEAAVKGDDATEEALLPKLAPARAQVEDARTRVAQVTSEYVAALSLSVSDPDAFRAQCKAQ